MDEFYLNNTTSKTNDFAQHLISLPTTDSAYIRVAELFHNGWKAQQHAVPRLEAIYRIQYPERAIAPYLRYRGSVSVSSARDLGSESLLFYGTAKACRLGEREDATLCNLPQCSLCAIIRQSYDVESCAYERSFRPFGVGIYTTSCSSRANESAFNPPGSSTRAMILNCVALGNPFRTHRASPSLRQPPQRCHSVVGLPGVDLADEEIVVYSNDAIRPAYLLVYEDTAHKPNTRPTDTKPSTLSKTSASDRRDSNISDASSNDSTPPTTPMASNPVSPTIPPIASNLHFITPPESSFSDEPLNALSSLSLEETKPRATSSSNGSLKSSDHIDFNVALTRLINRVRIGGSPEVTAAERKKQISVIGTAFQTNDENRHPFMTLSGAEARDTLNALQEILDDPYIWPSTLLPNDTVELDSQIRSRLRRLLMKLSIRGDVLPASLFLQDVECSSLHSIAGGGFADIFRGSLRGQPVALKKLRVYHIEESKKAEFRKEFYHEGLLWRNLRHRHVLPFLGVDDSIFKQSLCMVLPWMPNGSILTTIGKQRQRDDVTVHSLFLQIHRWLQEITLGLAYLHSEDIVHADLRGPNILIDADWGVRLADFGMALFGEAAGSKYGSQRGGAVRWMAPELIDTYSEEDEDQRPTFASDIYSLGCVIIELFTLEPPFKNGSEHQIVMKVLNGLRPPRPTFADGTEISDALWSVTSSCWAQSAHDRPSAARVVTVITEICSSIR